MTDKDHYQKLEDDFKSRRMNLQSMLDAIDEQEKDEHLYPALNSLKKSEPRYSDFQFVAEGGEKRIEAAFDSIAQRKIAFARPKKTQSAVYERFLREARLMAFLEHPNIMPVYDIGLEDEQPYFTMELIKGDNLAVKRGKKPLSAKELDEFLAVLVRVCDAVSFAHNKGVAHLDIKPQNIQIGPFGEVLLCDWGLSKIVSSHEELDLPEELDAALTADLTLRGVLRGTPGYMSPSLSKGNPGEISDDIYALGATLYFILCGQSPNYSKDLKETISKTVINDIEAPSNLFPEYGISSSLEAVALKALSKTGYKSVSGLRDEITSHLRGYATRAEEAGFIKTLILLYKRQKTLCNTIIVALIIVFSLTGFFINSLQNEKDKEALARQEAEEAQASAESSLTKYKSELRYNRFLMDGIDQSLKKIIREVEKENLPVDIQKILVKVGRGNINGEAYEAAAQMLETLAENSTGVVRNDAIHDLIFTKVFMHDFSGALKLLKTLEGDEYERAKIYQLISICEDYKDLEKPNGVLSIPDLKRLVQEVDKHKRSREWFYRHLFNYYLRKCHTDEQIIQLYEIVLAKEFPNKNIGVQVLRNNDKKVLVFTNAQHMAKVVLPAILDALHIHTLDLRETAVKSLEFTRQLSIKAINISGTRIKDLKPLAYIDGFELVVSSSKEGLTGLRMLKNHKIRLKISE